MERPEDFFTHVRMTAGRIIMIITYGIGREEAERVSSYCVRRNQEGLSYTMIAYQAD